MEMTFDILNLETYRLRFSLELVPKATNPMLVWYRISSQLSEKQDMFRFGLLNFAIHSKHFLSKRSKKSGTRGTQKILREGLKKFFGHYFENFALF
jgi:hypothetical protein